MIAKALGVALCAVLAMGCATSFTGSAHVENGRQGCEAKCQASGMQLSGMVFMGEYSDACVCELPGATRAARNDLVSEAASTTAGAAGVIMQMQQESQRQSQSR